MGTKGMQSSLQVVGGRGTQVLLTSPSGLAITLAESFPHLVLDMAESRDSNNVIWTLIPTYLGCLPSVVASHSKTVSPRTDSRMACVCSTS